MPVFAPAPAFRVFRHSDNIFAAYFFAMLLFSLIIAFISTDTMRYFFDISSLMP